MFVDKDTNKWKLFQINILDMHPTEDISLLKIQGDHWEETTIKVSFEEQFSSF